ncbi:uncharacterized protein LOC132397041 isoform X2 [Hypanus sabinus]|uniref:uncharacterized protein LOC132397041 isoform X2 n=1 Tax=Hypanus sabinus TaxID=79690 RepID=UPI0028C3BB24|nr:uncharacterized protein LOC132397041 isoform X2 [Hypanus sabinus]
MPTWWRLPGEDRGRINRREVADGEAGPNRVKQVCQKFQILEDQTVAHVLQEKEVEEHVAANRLKAQQARLNLTVARRLQEEEDERGWRLDLRLCRQRLDLEKHKETREEEFQQWEETRQRSHTQRKKRLRRLSGETGRRSREEAEMEKRAEASPWHGIHYSQARSRRPFIASKGEENAEWCRREGGTGRPHRGLGVEGEHEANGFGMPREMVVEQRSPAGCWDYVKQAEEGGDSPEGGDPLARTHDRLKGQRTRRGPEGRVDPPAASPTTGHLAVLPPAGSTDEGEHSAFWGSVSDSESRQRHRRPRGEPRAMRARAMSEDGHRTTRDRRGHKRSSPGPHPPRPREQPAMERRAVHFHPPLGPTSELMQSGRWKVGGGRTPSTTKGLGMENHWPLSRKEREANHPLAGDQKHIHRPLAGDQKHVHRPLAGDQKHVHRPLAGDQKHVSHPLAGDQKHVHRPLAGDQKHIHRPLVGDQKHVHRPLAGDQKRVHWPLPGGEDQVRRPLPPNQRQAQYPLVTNHTLHPLTDDKYIHHPPRTKAKGKQVHFLLASSDRASPSQMQLAQRDRQIQFLLDSAGKVIQPSSVGKQKRVHFPLEVGEKGIAVHSPLAKGNDAQHSLATNRKERRSPLAVKPNPIQYQLDSKDAEAIIDYVLDKEKGRGDSCPSRLLKSPADREDGSGQSRDSPREVVPAKARSPGLAGEQPRCTEKDSSSYPCSRRPAVMGGSVDSAGGSDGATDRRKVKAVDCVEAPRGRHRQPRGWDAQGRGRRKPERSRPRSPSNGLPAEAGKDSARGKGSAPRNGLLSSLWCSDDTLKALQALELRRVQLRKAAADEKQLQLARDEEFALDLLRQEITALSLSSKEKCCRLMQDVPGRRRKESPRSDSPSSVNVDWVEEPQLSKSAFF